MRKSHPVEDFLTRKGFKPDNLSKNIDGIWRFEEIAVLVPDTTFSEWRLFRFMRDKVTGTEHYLRIASGEGKASLILAMLDHGLSTRTQTPG
jgi:hypothetical protein